MTRLGNGSHDFDSRIEPCGSLPVGKGEPAHQGMNNLLSAELTLDYLQERAPFSALFCRSSTTRMLLCHPSKETFAACAKSNPI